MAKTIDVPPQLYSQEAEQAVLGALLIDPMAVHKVSGWLRPGDFYETRNEWLYDAIVTLSEREGADYVTLSALLEERNQLGDVGGAAYISTLINATPTAMHAVEYARTVERLGTLRRLFGVAEQIAHLAHSKNENVGDIFTRARQLVDGAAPMDSDGAILFWLDSLEAFIDQQLGRQADQVAIEAGEACAAVQFPFAALRRSVSTLRPGMLAIVAAASGIGKTSFLECCAEYWAQQGLQVAFFHFELSHQLMLDRRMCRVSGMPMAEVEQGTVDERTDRATATMRNWPGGIQYVHCPGWTMERVAATARQLAQKGRCDVVVVDYLQKGRLVYRQGINKASAVGDAVETLKNMAEQLGVPVLLASQFNRSSDGAFRKTARFIRDSGEPEEKANVVITLDREILEQTVTDTSGRVVAKAGDHSPRTDVRVDKNTVGPTGDMQLKMIPARFAFVDEGLPATPPPEPVF